MVERLTRKYAKEVFVSRIVIRWINPGVVRICDRNGQIIVEDQSAGQTVSVIPVHLKVDGLHIQRNRSKATIIAEGVQ
jgi:hypothetical protein